MTCNTLFERNSSIGHFHTRRRTSSGQTSRPTICSSNVNSRRTAHLVLVIVNSYLDGQTDDFESKGPSVHLLVPFPLESTDQYSDRDATICSSGVNLSRTFDDLSVKTNKSTSTFMSKMLFVPLSY